MKNNVVVITGGSSGIGLASAQTFAAHEYTVCILDLNDSPSSKEVVKSSGGKFTPLDVSSFTKVTEAIADIHACFARIDALVNSAGISSDDSITRMTEEVWDKVIDVDLKGTFNSIRATAPFFKEQGHGKIVNIASTLAIRARRNLSNYTAAKTGVIGLTKGVSRDLGKYNVNVNAVAPGLVETPLTAEVPEDIKNKLKEDNALGRLATPEDVANVIFFLCSEEARHITGEVIRVDGGQLA